MDKFPPPSTTPFTALGFDFGTQRIGVAFGQSLSGSAEPVAILKARDGIPQWQEIQQLIERWQPDVFVVGLPYNMDGSDSELLQRANKFGGRLHGRFHKPCYGMDERLSSAAAMELTQRQGNAGRIARGKRGAKSSEGAIDDLAALVILQDWFGELLKRSN